MSNYNEVKFLRRLLEEARREVRIMQAQRDGARERCRSLEDLVKAQQESIREANDARCVSQHFAMKHFNKATKLEEAITGAYYFYNSGYRALAEATLCRAAEEMEK